MASLATAVMPVSPSMDATAGVTAARCIQLAILSKADSRDGIESVLYCRISLPPSCSNHLVGSNRFQVMRLNSLSRCTQHAIYPLVSSPFRSNGYTDNQRDELAKAKRALGIRRSRRKENVCGDSSISSSAPSSSSSSSVAEEVEQPSTLGVEVSDDGIFASRLHEAASAQEDEDEEATTLDEEFILILQLSTSFGGRNLPRFCNTIEIPLPLCSSSSLLLSLPSPMTCHPFPTAPSHHRRLASASSIDDEEVDNEDGWDLAIRPSLRNAHSFIEDVPVEGGDAFVGSSGHRKTPMRLKREWTEGSFNSLGSVLIRWTARGRGEDGKVRIARSALDVNWIVDPAVKSESVTNRKPTSISTTKRNGEEMSVFETMLEQSQERYHGAKGQVEVRGICAIEYNGMREKGWIELEIAGIDSADLLECGVDSDAEDPEVYSEDLGGARLPGDGGGRPGSMVKVAGAAVIGFETTSPSTQLSPVLSLRSIHLPFHSTYSLSSSLPLPPSPGASPIHPTSMISAPSPNHLISTTTDASDTSTMATTSTDVNACGIIDAETHAEGRSAANKLISTALLDVYPASPLPSPLFMSNSPSSSSSLSMPTIPLLTDPIPGKSSIPSSHPSLSTLPSPGSPSPTSTSTGHRATRDTRSHLLPPSPLSRLPSFTSLFETKPPIMTSTPLCEINLDISPFFEFDALKRRSRASVDEVQKGGKGTGDGEAKRSSSTERSNEEALQSPVSVTSTEPTLLYPQSTPISTATPTAHFASHATEKRTTTSLRHHAVSTIIRIHLDLSMIITAQAMPAPEVDFMVTFSLPLRVLERTYTASSSPIVPAASPTSSSTSLASSIEGDIVDAGDGSVEETSSAAFRISIPTIHMIAARRMKESVTTTTVSIRGSASGSGSIDFVPPSSTPPHSNGVDVVDRSDIRILPLPATKGSAKWVTKNSSEKEARLVSERMVDLMVTLPQTEEKVKPAEHSDGATEVNDEESEAPGSHQSQLDTAVEVQKDALNIEVTEHRQPIVGHPVVCLAKTETRMDPLLASPRIRSTAQLQVQRIITLLIALLALALAAHIFYDHHHFLTRHFVLLRMQPGGRIKESIVAPALDLFTSAHQHFRTAHRADRSIYPTQPMNMVSVTGLRSGFAFEQAMIKAMNAVRRWNLDFDWNDGLSWESVARVVGWERQ